VGRRLALGTAVGIAGAAYGVFGILPERIARSRNRVTRQPPYRATELARELHRHLLVVDLHADSLTWGRDLRVRASYGHVDVPRLIEGGIALQALAVATKVPRRPSIEHNDARSDDVILLAIAQRWPRSTWRSLMARALYQADRARSMARGSDGRLSLIETAEDLDAYIARRRADPGITAALLTIEGAHALEGDPAALDRLIDAGFRMMSLTHFFDNEFGGSAHGIDRTGLTGPGRELVGRMEARSMLVDVAHASARTIDDILTMATRPVVASHTGVRATSDSVRNLSDDQVRGIAATGGLIGIGFWPTATGGDDVAAIGRAIGAAVGLAGVDHVALGSDFDGAVPLPFDATGMVQLTDVLISDGFTDAEIGAIMGGNALRLLTATLPRREAEAAVC